MTITRNDFALFLAGVGGAWVGSAQYERGGEAVAFWACAIIAVIAAFWIKRDV